MVDDDPIYLQLMENELRKSGYTVTAVQDPSKVENLVKSESFDVVLCDIMLPKIDGFALIKIMRKTSRNKNIRIIMVSAKKFDFDKERSKDLGADAYLEKPVESEVLIANIEWLLDNRARIKFWGVRGSLATPGHDTLKYGGNTPCVEVRLPNKQLFVFDAGSGMKVLGDELIKVKGRSLKVNLMITHPHWDHIQGLPFFKPAFVPGNEVAVFGSSHGDISLRQVISGQMESIYFPIKLKTFGARVYFKELTPGEHEIDGYRISAMYLNHPGQTLGYRLWWGKKSVAYITDNELVPPELQRKRDTFYYDQLNSFLDGVDILIHDTCYTDEEYKTKVGWGHPPLSEVCKLVSQVKAKRFFMFHYDPDTKDPQVDSMMKTCIDYFKENGADVHCQAAFEGLEVFL